MKRKILALSLVLSLVIGLSACNLDSGNEPVQTATGILPIKEVTSQTEKAAESKTEITQSETRLSDKFDRNEVLKKYDYTERDLEYNRKHITFNLVDKMVNDFTQLKNASNTEELGIIVNSNSELNDILNYPNFCDSVKKVYIGISGQFDLSKLSIFKNLESLQCTLYEEKNFDISGIEMCTNLKKVEFYNAIDYGIPTGYVYNVDKLTELPKLEEIYKKFIDFDDEYVISKIGTLKSITYNCGNFDINAICECKNLSKVVLYLAEFDDKLLNNILEFKDLKELFILESSGAIDIRKIADISTLEVFGYDLWGKVSDDDIKYITDRLPGCVLYKFWS